MKNIVFPKYNKLVCNFIRSVYFLSKYSKGCRSFNAGCLVSMDQSGFGGFFVALEDWSPRVTQSGLGAWESPVETK